MGFFDFLNPLKIITGPLEKITDAIVQWQIAKAKATTDARKIEADEHIATLQAKRDVLIAESGDKINRLVRALMAIPVVILLWKLIVFDNVFGAWLGWSTPPLSTDVWMIVLTVIGFYFVDSIAARFKK
jgi:hypothetical protein